MDRKQQPAMPAQIAQIALSHTVSGPLPPPADMMKYEQACRGSADRIISMAEKLVELRVFAAKEQAEDTARARRETRLGQCLSFVLTIVAFGVAAYCAKVGATKIGVTVAGVTLVSVVSTLIRHKK